MTSPTVCPSFGGCSAPLCPLDAEIDGRIWYPDEPVCRSAIYGKHRWIRKQRSIVRRQTKSWLDKPVTFKMLFDASRPMKLTEEQRESRRQLMKQLRTQKFSTIASQITT